MTRDKIKSAANTVRCILSTYRLLFEVELKTFEE